MNNPPAFPCPQGTPESLGGMSLRDYFAAKAMQTILQDDPDYHQKHQFLDLSDFSYRCADAMLKARAT
jgi:hypothetical protein